LKQISESTNKELYQKTQELLEVTKHLSTSKDKIATLERKIDLQ